MSVADEIKQKLEREFQPVKLELIDESYKHAGHAGARPEGESHFRLAIVSQAFTGKNRIDIHRMIFHALGEELKSKIHALTIRAEGIK